MGWIKQSIATLIGRNAEQQAAEYLCQQGLRLIEKNYRCRLGEIDLIMQQGAELIFVEVKYRKASQYGQASEFFTLSKRKKVEKAIAFYLAQKKLNPSQIAHRIDVLAIDSHQIQWFKAV